jgi:hypothetical protein
MAHIKDGLFYKQKKVLKLLLVNISSYFITSYKWGAKVDFVHINEIILQQKSRMEAFEGYSAIERNRRNFLIKENISMCKPDYRIHSGYLVSCSCIR